MRRSTSAALAAFVALLAMGTDTAEAQNAQARSGFWFNAGLGVGTLGCEDCEGRVRSISGNLSLGGTINPKLLIGVGTTGWSKSEDGATLTAGTLDARLRFYPSLTNGFFLTGGVGLGAVRAEISGFGGATETGVGGLMGIGYDFRIAQNVSITPYLNWFAVSASEANANVAQFGFGITTH